MSRQPRRSFAAPLIMIAALPASACIVTSNKPATTTGDGKTVESRDHRGTGEDPKVISNPPRPDKTYEQDQSWSIQLQDDGSCLAYAQVDCPADAKCNPPRPAVVTCPQGIDAGDPLDMWVSAGSSDCYVSFGGGSCPVGASCNPPPPQKAECPQ